MKLLFENWRKYLREPLDEKVVRGGKDKRLLYHISKRPARPVEKLKWFEDWDDMKQDFVRSGADDTWKRYWLDQPVKSGVFLSPNPIGIAINHGVFGHIYAYRIPEWVIKKAGGIHRYDWGSEILIPEELWNKAAAEIEFLGKKMEAQDLKKDLLERGVELGRPTPPGAPLPEVKNKRGYLNEIGEGTPTTYDYKLAPRTSDGENVLYTFKSEIEGGGGSYYNVVFKQDESATGKDYWDISFETEFEGLGETGEGQPLKIVSTVANIVKDFVSRPDLNKNIRTYAFAGSPKRGEIIDVTKPSSRTKLYTRFLKKQMPEGTELFPLGNAIWFILPEPPKPPDEPVDPEYLDQLGGLF